MMAEPLPLLKEPILKAPPPPKTDPILEFLPGVSKLVRETLVWFQSNWLQIAIAIGAAILLYFVLVGLRWLAIRASGKPDGQGWRTFMGDLARRTNSFFLAAFAAYEVTHLLAPDGPLTRFIDLTFTIAFAVQGAIWLREFIMAFVARRAGTNEDGDDLDSAINVIRVIVNVGVWLLALVLVLDNIGVNVTALVAGLGVGGIAIGLAAQGIFGDLFAALSILFDRPFKVGDVISFGGNSGTVEVIGLKTTRIRALSGEQLIVSNAKLLDQQISNMRRIKERRIVFTIGVIYQTPPDVLERIPAEIEKIVAARPLCRFERAHFFRFGDSSLDFEIAFFVLEPDFQTMMDERQAVSLAILRRFAKLKVEFAYPTQTTFTALPDGTMVDPRPIAGP
jgi:small-conductance mechanosensitive channel